MRRMYLSKKKKNNENNVGGYYPILDHLCCFENILKSKYLTWNKTKIGKAEWGREGSESPKSVRSLEHTYLSHTPSPPLLLTKQTPLFAGFVVFPFSLPSFDSSEEKSQKHCDSGSSRHTLFFSLSVSADYFPEIQRLVLWFLSCFVVSRGSLLYFFYCVCRRWRWNPRKWCAGVTWRRRKKKRFTSFFRWISTATDVSPGSSDSLLVWKVKP